MSLLTHNICLIGFGYWGKNLLRNMVESAVGYNVSVAETDPGKRRLVQKLYPSVTLYNSAEEALASKDVTAVVIATETKSHYALAHLALASGRHVLVEKPLTTSVAEAEKLHLLAVERNLILMVDHIFLYHPVVHKMKEYFSRNMLGRINYIDATRVNLGIYQNDVNVLWDLACHDISIVNYLVSERPSAVRAIGRVNPAHGTEDIAYMFLYYPSGLLVQINSSWASPVKMRRMVIGGEKKMIIYDDIEPTNKLTVYDYEQNVQTDINKSKLTDYRLGNILIPKYEPVEALHNVVAEFYDCISTGRQPISNGENGIEVVNILEKAQQSLSLNGAIIPLP